MPMKYIKKRYVIHAQRNGNCNITSVLINDIKYTVCKDYEKDEGLELCMKTHCKECRKYKECFGGGNNGEQRKSS